MQICSICGTKIRESPKPYGWMRDDLDCPECGKSHFQDAPVRDSRRRTKKTRKNERKNDWTLGTFGSIL